MSQEIFRIPYSLSTATALEVENHENIVSLIVEEQLFKKMHSDIEKYASRIQAVLPRTRTVILTFPENTQPFLIASANERLYYSGLPNHGEKTQKLVGTIVIGNIPLPTVHKDARSFLSIFPYVDFEEPNFVWSWDKKAYEYLIQDRKNGTPELWHSVIAPHTGNLSKDVEQIKTFFGRVYEYDNKKGNYALLGKDPQVLYADSVRDARATSPGSLSAYEELFVPNQEHFEYNRYTKEFAQYLHESYLSLMKTAGITDIVPFSQWRSKKASPNSTLSLDSLDEIALESTSFLSSASDISTRLFSRELIPGFVKTLSEKYVGDVSRWIHQTGRYYDGYSQVRADTIPELIQERDTLSTRILKEANDSFEKLVDEYIEGSLSVNIPVLVSRNTSARGENFTYTNYFFGKKADTLSSAAECTLIRGSTFGSTNTKAEMNHGYHIQSIESDAKKIEQDAQDKIRCDDRVASYWGGNTPMNLDFSSGLGTLKDHKYHDFSVSVFDPAAGKKTDKIASPFDCLKTDLLLNPYVRRVSVFRGFREYKWPEETDGKRYSCATEFNTSTEYFSLNPSPETTENIFSTLLHCQGNGNVTLLGPDGKTLNICASTGPGGTYKLVSSLVRHTSPDNETYGKQLTSLSAPNLPIDENRYVLYVNRDLQEKRFDYPNVFDITIPIGASEKEIKQKIHEYLRTFDTQLSLRKEQKEMGVFSHLVPQIGRKTKQLSLSDILAQSPDLENNLVASIRWKNIPTAMKYQQGILDALRGDKTEKVALFGHPERTYEIAYMGGMGDAKNFVIGYNPDENAEYPEWYQSILDVQDNYEETIGVSSLGSSHDDFTLSPEEYDDILGVSSETPEDGNENTTEGCNYENAVPIWEWLSAIQCWLKNLFDTDWELGVSDFSFDWSPYLSLTLGDRVLFSTTDTVSLPQSDTNNNHITDAIESTPSHFSLRNIPSRYTLEPKGTITLESYLEKNDIPVGDNGSQIQLVLRRMANLDTGKVFTPQSDDWETLKKQTLTVSGSQALKNGKAIWTIHSLTDARISFEFETRIQSGNTITIQSSIFTLSPESKFPQFTLLSSKNTLTPRTIHADDENGIVIQFSGENLPQSINIDIANYVTNKKILSLQSVPVVDQKARIGSPAGDIVLHKAGKYVMTMTTSQGVSERVDFVIDAGSPKKILTGLPNIILAQEQYTTHFSLEDTWGNNIDTDAWNATIHTSQPVLFGSDTKAKQDSALPLSAALEFQPVREGTITLDIVAQHNQDTIQQSTTLSVLSDIVVETTLNHAIVGEKLPIEFVIKTKQGAVITQWNTPLRILNKGTEAHLENTLVSFSEGRGKATLIVGTQTGVTSFYSPDILIGKKFGTDIEIHPGVPDRLTFSGPDILLAQPGKSQILEIHIFDKYGNYIHPSTVDVRIEASPKDIIESLGKVERIEGDTYGVRLKSLGYPGRVLLRGAVWNDGVKSKKSTLENVWKVHVLPVITANDVVKNTWNTLTQVLLGGPFGQFVTSGYFAGSALFSPETQLLSITTLVDTPRPGLFSVSSTGALNILGMPQFGVGLQSDWQPDTRGLFGVMISDKRLGSLAKVTYPLLTSDDKMIFTPRSSDITISDNVIYYQGVALTDLQHIFSQKSLSLVFTPNAEEVQFAVMYKQNNIGTLDIMYTPRTPSLRGGSNQTFGIEFFDSNLVSDTLWGSTSSADISGFLIREMTAEPSFTGGPVEDGYSAYPDQYGMGWTGTNLGLLQFAGGDYWAMTQRSFSDYVTINLGDPLISLPEYKVDTQTGFDTTIGSPVYQSKGEITSFHFSDTNNDNQKDILVTDTDNTLSAALSKKDGTYLDVGELLLLGNAREGSVRVGDFFSDGFADAAYVDAGGILHIVSQDRDGFAPIELVSNRQRDIGQIHHMEVFDMDHDAHDDIIILDSLGQLSIFYGGDNKKFTYQFVDHVFDFDFADKSLFSGAIHYTYPGFTFPDFAQTNDPLLRLQQEQIQSVLFTSLTLPSSSAPQIPTSTPSLGSYVAASFGVDKNAGAGNSMKNIVSEYDALARQYGDTITVKSETNNQQTLRLIKAPFIDTSRIEISKKYISLEKEGSIMPGSMIQGTITLKNRGNAPLSQIVIAEQIPAYLESPIETYTIKQGGSTLQRNFIISAEGNVADLRKIVIAPGETIELTYVGKFATFSFGTFDVGFLEDKNDPLMNIDVTKDKILTINTQALAKTSIPEKEFHGAEKYGDIRINPNNTCGGPLFLWRSHNTFDRTYQKTLLVRDIPNPEDISMDISNNPSDHTASSYTQNILSSLSQGASAADLKKIQETYSKTAEKELDAFHQDSDSDSIPDRYDEDYGDVFTIENSGNSSQISVSLGKLDQTIDQAVEGVETFMSGLSCGFGDAGCIAQPMNWTANVPGNTITALGYAVPGVNQAPVACYKDVRCGIPLFSFPTASYPYFWPPNPDEGGGAFDIGASNVVSSQVSQNTTFTGGYGTSQFRLFVGATLTGAIAEVACFGPNNMSNPLANLPGLFPVRFDGNCIFAAQPLTQCSDDGTNDIVSELEMDQFFEPSESTSLTDGDECGFFNPVTAYPDTLITAAQKYVSQPTSENIQILRTQLSEHAALVTGEYAADTSLLLSSSSPYTSIQSNSSNTAISYPEIGSGNGMIQLKLDSTSFDVTKTGPIFDVKLKSITAFPRFIMDWYHRQLDEIVSSFSSLPDIKIFLPDLGSGFADGGWIPELSNRSTPVSALTSSQATSETTSSAIGAPFDAATSARNSIVSGIQGGVGGIQAAFEYLSLLPMVDVHPEMISFHLPWLDRSAMQSWIYRNEAILAQWEALPKDAFGNAVNFQPLIGSIRSNIEIVKTYMTLPEQLQNLFYLKEKFLYEIMKNIYAVQHLMGGWMYDNGQRFKTWVETFILVTKLWDLWQILIDVFDDYEQSCAVCNNEQWNLQEWLWIIISAVIPPIPVIQMPRWPDIELDFSDLNLGVDVAYPVFNFSFYPLDLPDMPSPTFTGLTLPTIPQLPPLPDLNLDFEVPTLNLPKLPNLPPAPVIPELSQSISVVLKIFKIVTLIQCLYRKVPLSPEWYVGTKIAHKTDRQGYLPIDFLNVQMPSVAVKWIDAIRVSTHVDLTYDVTFIIDMIRSALEPLADFPRDLSSYTGDIPSSVNINLDSENGSSVQTSSVEQLPALVGSLYQNALQPQPSDTSSELQSLSRILASYAPEKNTSLFPEVVETSHYVRQLDERVGLLSNALQKDIAENRMFIADLSDLSVGKKNVTDIAWLQDMNPSVSHLASMTVGSKSALLDTVSSWREKTSHLGSALTSSTVAPLAVTTPSPTTISPVNTVVTQKQNTTQLRTSKGSYITKNGISHRLHYFYENQSENTKLFMIDDDGDGDKDIFYTLGNTIYRKENHTQSRKKIYITDSPQIFTPTTMMKEFFGIRDGLDMTLIPHDMQIFLRDYHLDNSINVRYLIHEKNDHQQFDIYKTWGQDNPVGATYRVDGIQVPDVSNAQGYTILQQPIITSLAGQSTLYRRKIYRTLLPGAKYIDPSVGTTLQDLSTDFTIRAQKTGYAKEKTRLQILFNNQKKDVTLLPGETLFFAQDSRVVIQSGALILPSDDYESYGLDRADIDTPVFPDDRIVTGNNGIVSLVFPDKQETDIFASQTWTLFYHSGLQTKIQDFSLSVVPGWYYVVSYDAASLPEKRIPRTTLFDAYTPGSNGELADTLPTTLQLDFDQPTEVDFQQYFPLDTIAKVEISGLSDAFWKQITATKILFQTSQENKSFTLRVTSKQGVIYAYALTLETKPATLSIQTVDNQKNITGTLSQDTLLPITLQSFIDGKPWTLSSPVVAKNKIFTTSLASISPEWTVSYADKKIFSLKRETGVVIGEPGVTFMPLVQIGSPLVVKTLLNGTEVARMTYQAHNLLFQQIPARENVQKNTLNLISDTLRLEPASANDATLKGGAYIVDKQYRPMIAFDNQGRVRYLDSSLSFTIQYEGDMLILNISRGGDTVGTLILLGNALTAWGK